MATIVPPAALPASVAALPFLFTRPQRRDPNFAFRSALAAAAAAERADDKRRNTRGRLAFLLCELGCQWRRRGGDLREAIPLGRADLADALGIGPSRVKRVLALLALSRVAEGGAHELRVLDWPRLAASAGYDPRRLGISGGGAAPRTAEGEHNHVTAAGDPACFE